MKFSLSIVVVLACLSFTAAAQAPPRLEFIDGTVRVTGALSDTLFVYTHEAFTKKINQPIAGTYSPTADGVTFEPLFPFAPGTTYHAVFSGSVLTFEVPKKNSTPTSIESVYPRSTVVPENLLRIYICFSGPMMPGDAYDHVRLFNDNGEQVERPFLVVDQELWDVERKRLTLLFDPGRIKRGLKANLDLGPPLKEGSSYNLVLDSTWRDIDGNTLQGSFKKILTVTEPQRSKLSLKQLKVIAPVNPSTEALTIYFDRPIDHALVTKYISVWNSSSGNVSGKFELAEDDRTLKFMADHSWQGGSYQVRISPLLEDVAGNNFNNPFDLDLSRDSRVTSTESLILDFTIRQYLIAK